MDMHKLTSLPEFKQLADVLDDALHLLDVSHMETEIILPADDIQPSLFEQCIELCRQGVVRDVEPIRTIHHLSCTGGTLISQCLAAMPNVFVLNEVDPLSTMNFNEKQPTSNPTDILALVTQSSQTYSQELLIQLFLQNISLLRSEFGLLGKRLLLRDHSHSHFMTETEISQRPSLLTILDGQFPTASIVTVRDPVDSYVDLKKSGLQHFKSGDFDDYCLRYHAFLDAYEDTSVFRYEDFVDAPQAVMKEICRVLQLPYADTFFDTFDTFNFSRDGGGNRKIMTRSSADSIDDGLLHHITISRQYQKLISRLGYTHVSQRVHVKDFIGFRKNSETYHGSNKPFIIQNNAQHNTAIVVAGMRHSGSTALFNIIRLMLIEAGLKFVSCYSEYQGCIEKVRTANCLGLIKIHEMRDDVAQVANVVLTTRRDLRDTVASAVRRQFPLLKKIGSPVEYAKYNRSLHDAWNSISDYQFVYEKFIINPIDCIHTIAQLVDIDSVDAEKIYDQVSHLPQDDYDTTLLSPSHITDPERKLTYKDSLDKKIIAEIENHNSNWLKEYGYTIPTCIEATI
ncbi:MAG: sulfotransferase [Desulfobacteraceae bacterium]|jgi:hypothetical protein